MDLFNVDTPHEDPDFISKAEATLHKLHEICDKAGNGLAQGTPCDKLVNSVHKLSKTLHDLVLTYELIQDKKQLPEDEVPYHIPLPWVSNEK